jgi:hypothetical protein
MSELKNFQDNLIKDNETKFQFIDKKVDSEEDSSSSSEEESLKIVAPRRKAGKGGLDKMLLEQSIAQQNAYLKAQKAIYKLKSEIDIEEVKTRYLKLDLNNIQVSLDEEKEKNKVLYLTQVENWSLRIAIVLYILWIVISKLF